MLAGPAGVQTLAAQLQERATGTGAVRMKTLQDNPALVEHFSEDLMPHLLHVYNGTMSQQVGRCLVQQGFLDWTAAVKPGGTATCVPIRSPLSRW